MKRELRIVFMGTPEFAVESLKKLLDAGKNIVAVITAPDKPAGRGQKTTKSAVKQFAEAKNIKVLQPTNLKSKEFHDELKELQVDLQIVVAFRMLPESVWDHPEMGTFNLHASLLPAYRGAAPINWAIINGEKETGVTTFFLQQEIDTGEIIFQEKVAIGKDETAGELHDKLMHLGADLVLKTVNAIEENNFRTTAQSEILKRVGKTPEAPKIFKEDCRIDWSSPLHKVHDFIRGLSPYPAAWTELENLKTGKSLSLKIYRSRIESTSGILEKKQLKVAGREIKIGFPEGNLIIDELQLSGKKKMLAKEFINGVDLNSYRIK